MKDYIVYKVCTQQGRKQVVLETLQDSKDAMARASELVMAGEWVKIVRDVMTKP